MSARSALFLLLALSACSVPTTQAPAIGGDRIREEAAVQRRLAFGAPVAMRPHSQSRENSPLDEDLADLKRIADIGWRVLAGAATACGEEVEGQSGALLATISDIPEHLRRPYLARFSFEYEALVVAVAAGSPADRSGLAVGDLIVAIDGNALAKNKAVARDIDGRLAGRAGQVVAVTIRRNGNTLGLTLIPQLVCRSHLELARGGGVNAYANGQVVAVMSGMMRFLEDDDHLATVIGHEIAHNIRGHLRMQAENEEKGASFGNVLDLLTGANKLKTHWANVAGRAFSQSFETEADYVGLYLTAEAGFDIGKAPSLWRRMAMANPATINHASTHPTTPNRFVTLEATVREIEAKRAAGQSLAPEKRKGLF